MPFVQSNVGRMSKHDLENSLHVLIICATNYDESMNQIFNHKKSHVYSSQSYEYIHEIIVLNLGSDQNLSEFFGLEMNDALMNAIHTIIDKAEVEYEELN